MSGDTTLPDWLKNSAASTSSSGIATANLPQLDARSRLMEKDAYGDFRSAFVFEEIDGNGFITVGNPYLGEDKMKLTRIPTRCTKDQVEDLISKTIFMPETCAMFDTLARNYRNRDMVLFQGPSAIGKTFIALRFFQSVYGPNFKPLEARFHKGSQAEDLYAKYVPTVGGLSSDKLDLWDKFTISELGLQELQKIADIRKASQGLPSEVAERFVSESLRKLVEKVVGEKTDFTLELGVIPLAYCANINDDGSISYPDDPRNVEPGGSGAPCLGDELTRARSEVSNAFLPIRGTGHGIADTLSVMEAGKQRFHKGPDTWFVFTQNPVNEDHEAVQPPDGAFLRGVSFHNYQDLQASSYMQAARAHFSFRITGKPPHEAYDDIFDFTVSKDLILELAEVAALFHMEYKEIVKEYYLKQETKIPTTLDDLAALSKAIFQNPRMKGGKIDVVNSIRDAVEETYLKKFTGEEEHDGDNLQETLCAVLDEILSGKPYMKRHTDGVTMKREDILQKVYLETALTPKEKDAIATAELNDALSGLASDSSVPADVASLLNSLVGDANT